MSHDDIDKQVKSYMLVFGALMVLTLVTVGIAYLHFSPVIAIGLALVVASVKGTLVAGVFMHLFSENKLIYWSLALTVLFFFFVLLIPVITESNNIHLGH